MGLRDLYNEFEKAVTPIVNEATRTPQFAQAAAIATALNKTVRSEAEKWQARVWHAINLPAGTDVKRLKQQVGSLDRELRLLAMELDRARREGKRRGDPGPEHD